MAVMSTTLTEYADNGNSRTYELSGHTTAKVQLVLHRRRVPTGNQVVVEDDLTVLFGTEDSNGDILPQKVGFTVQLRRPLAGIAADVTAALAVFRDIVAGDEFGAMVARSAHPDNGIS